MTQSHVGVCSLLAISVLTTSTLGGCAQSRQDFSTFAQAGATYTAAMDKLLTVAGASQVDASSWKLVADERDLPHGVVPDSAITLADQTDEARLAQISRLRLHNALLARYFGLLADLADSKAPARIETAVGGVVDQIDALGLTTSVNSKVFASVAKLVVDARIQGALRNELEVRNETIQKELIAQESLVEALRGQIVHALGESRDLRRQTLIVEPLVASGTLSKPEAWVTTRRNITTQTLTVEELSQATNAAKALREGYQALVSGEATLERLKALLTDIEGVLAVAEALNTRG